MGRFKISLRDGNHQILSEEECATFFKLRNGFRVYDRFFVGDLVAIACENCGEMLICFTGIHKLEPIASVEEI